MVSCRLQTYMYTKWLKELSIMYQHCGTACSKQITYELAFVREKLCLAPVRRFPSSSRSIRFGDVSEANGRETPSHFRMDHVTRNALAARKNEA